MGLSRHKYEEIVTLLRMRGVTVGAQRAGAVFHELERVDSPTFADIFDRLRSKGAAISFSVERGIIATSKETDRLRQERNAREMLDIKRRAAEFEAADGPRIWRGAALRRLIERDVDQHGRLRGPSIPGWVL